MTGHRPPVVWLLFAVSIALLLAVDLGLVQRHPSTSRRGAIWWCAVVLAAAAAFALLIRWQSGGPDAITFATGYVVELALSVDNLLVFVLLLDFFAVPAPLHGVVLNWGILGALVMRGAMVVAGVALLHRFEWIFYLLGALLLVTGIRMALGRTTAADPERNMVIRIARRILPMSPTFDGARFVTRVDGRLVATPLLFVVLVVEWTDLVFATDSIPAIFAITRDPFLIYTSNAFAVVGLRALYFAAATALARFTEVRTGVAIVLVLIGIKMLVSRWVEVPAGAALGVVGLVLSAAILIGVIRGR